MKSDQKKNNFPEQEKKKKPLPKTIYILIFIFILILMSVGASVGLSWKYQNEIYPGIKVNGLDLSGLTKTQAKNILQGKFKQTYGQRFVFVYKDEEKTLNNKQQEFLSLNLESLVEKAYAQGRKNNLFFNHLQILALLIFQKQIPLDYNLEKQLLKKELTDKFSSLQDPAQNSRLEIDVKDSANKQFEINFTSSQSGNIFNFNQAIEILDSSIQKMQNPIISLNRKSDKPKITLDQAKKKREKIIKIAKMDAPELIYKDKTWEIPWSDFVKWLKLDLNAKEEIIVSLDQQMVSGHLQAIAQEIDRKATNARFQIDSGRVTEFTASKNGQKLNQEETYKRTVSHLIDKNNPSINLIVEVEEPEKSVAKSNELGIEEMLGSGWSDFSGSPYNRRHNIGIGAASLHGLLIAPGEEFSLVEALGEVNAQNGYKPELVIKKNETIPEYGGGLCQVATTMFRTVLQAGLKITERANHSYRVSYYEPAGTDATIYIPHPDFRFLNDTDNYILIQSKLWGNNLTFEIWGADDERKVWFEGRETVDNIRNLIPKIFNIVSPGPAKEIETTELEPGKKRLSEYAHRGADTVFYQYIEKPGQQTEKITWSSHYIPWQEVWLVGVDPEEESKEEEDQNASKNDKNKEQTENKSQPETDPKAGSDADE